MRQGIVGEAGVEADGGQGVILLLYGEGVGISIADHNCKEVGYECACRGICG